MKNFQPDIRQFAQSLGFDAVGFADPRSIASAGNDLKSFLDQGFHGDMAWMQANADKRGNPGKLWPEAKSAIVVGHNYAPETNPLDKLEHPTIGNISCYAQNKDYHDVMKKKLRQLARWLAETYGCDVKLFVDTAPVMEKPLAEAAQLGWQGKHTCLVSREFGSWLFIGSVFTTLSLPLEGGAAEPRARRGGGDLLMQKKRGQIEPLPTPRSPTGSAPSALPQGEGNYSCGSCTACLDICPTDAFTAPHQLDARRCISYLTIEHKEQIPLEFRKAIGNRIYGCDDCLAVCPWNKFAQTSKESAYHPRDALQSPLLKDLVILDDAAFRALFSGSPIKRIGRNRFVRNVLVAIGNSNDPTLCDTIRPLCNDDSPLVSEMAHWALGELQSCTI